MLSRASRCPRKQSPEPAPCRGCGPPDCTCPALRSGSGRCGARGMVCLGAGPWPRPSPSLSGLAWTQWSPGKPRYDRQCSLPITPCTTPGALGSLAPRRKGAASVLPGVRCPRPVQSSPSRPRDAVSAQTTSPRVTRCSFRAATQTHRPLPAAGHVLPRSVTASRPRAAATPALGPPSWLSGPWPFHAALGQTPGKAGSAPSSPATQTLRLE